MAKNTPYHRSFIAQVRRGYEEFWKKKQLRWCDGANEPGCPPNTVRTNLARQKGDFYWFGKTDSINPQGPLKGQSWADENSPGQEEEMVP